LAATVDAHRIFGDLFELSTFFVPRSMLPALPAELQKALGFHWRP
jgi:tryptophan 2,3-dioxygenase